MRTSVLIVAGGSGTRMGSDMPKQFLPLEGRPVIVRSVEGFISALDDAALYIALPDGLHGEWEKAAARYGLDGRCTACRGGETRFHTVRNSLEAMDPCDIVLIHDAVRPLVPRDVIIRVTDGAATSGACIPVTMPVDSLRALTADGGSAPFDRSVLRAVQTPQGFAYDLLLAAYRQDYDPRFTDDASVVEAAGHAITLCEGSTRNIKITYPEDFAVARALLVEETESKR
ncbi:MAG: 2-C-methyl-D-erythritol 4-phosphate cytidylyltransferase [Alistipes sp.]|nr:2-C-methyl-D-erythritol 4-phosphate cytidylyltransferase [Alistipes sp.]